MEHVPNSKHLKYGYKKAHILPRYRDICKTVNIRNIFIYNWTYYMNNFTEHVPNSNNLKYGYIRYIFSSRHIDICETVNIWNIGI